MPLITKRHTIVWLNTLVFTAVLFVKLIPRKMQLFSPYSFY